MTPICSICGDEYDSKRCAAGYDICMACGERKAVSDRQLWCVAPMHKSNYQLITDRRELIGLNNKGGLVK